MFKRKTTLPARPPIPSKDEIVDDLTQAAPDDAVFNIDAENITINTIHVSEYYTTNDLPQDPKDSGSRDQLEDLDSNQAYLKVASFVEKMNHLEKYLTALEINKNNLKNLEESLFADIAKVEEEFKKRSET